MNLEVDSAGSFPRLERLPRLVRKNSHSTCLYAELDLQLVLKQVHSSMASMEDPNSQWHCHLPTVDISTFIAKQSLYHHS